MMRGSRTFILGHFGSGKTEVAIHHALSLTTGAKRPLLLDFDFITPYYRSRDLIQELAREGVEVIAPGGELARSDLPIITARAVQAITDYDGPVVVDVGGDEGARVVGSVAGHLDVGSYEAWMVINPFRPGTGTPKQVTAYARWLEQIARLTFTGLVNNANVGLLTSPQDVLDGLEQVTTVAAMLGLPLCFTAATSAVSEQVRERVVSDKVISLRLKMRPPWELDPLGNGSV